MQTHTFRLEQLIAFQLLGLNYDFRSIFAWKTDFTPHFHPIAQKFHTGAQISTHIMYIFIKFF